MEEVQAEKTAIRAISRLDMMETHLCKIEDEWSTFRGLLESLPVMLVVDKGDWVAVSRSFSDLLGWSSDDVQKNGRNWYVHPEDRGVTDAEVERALRDGDVGTIVNRYRKKIGGYQKLKWEWGPPWGTGLLWAVAHDLGAA